MLDVVYGYKNLLENIETYINQSKFKKEYFIEELKLSKATFYNKIKKKSFSVAEMLKLSTILFPEEAKAFAIKQALESSRNDSLAGRIKNHNRVMARVRKRWAE